MRKGQFFLIGAILLISILIGLTFSRGSFYFSEIDLSSYLLKRTMEEFPIAINAIITENKETQYLERELRSYLSFQNFYLKKSGLNTKYYFLIGVPYGDSVNVTLGNFYGRLENLSLNVGDNVKEFSLNYTEIKSLSFKEVPDFFTVEFNFTVNGEKISNKFSTSRKVFYLIKMEGGLKDTHYEKLKIG